MKILKFVIIVFVVLILYAVFLIFSERYPRVLVRDDRIKVLKYGYGKRTVVGMEVALDKYSYVNYDSLYKNLKRYMDKASKYFDPNTIVIFPEYVGTWTVASLEKERVFESDSLLKAMFWVILHNPFKFLESLLFYKSYGKDKLSEAVFRMKAQDMVNIYYKVFSNLSKEYGVYIVGGSIPLPSPFVKDGRIFIRKDAPIYNVSFLFGKDGKAYKEVVKKLYPVPEEQLFTRPHIYDKDISIPVFDIGSYRLGVLICADAWYPLPYSILSEKNVDFVAVVSFITPEGIWNEPWKGYSFMPPKDFDKSDVGKITEKQAWIKYALYGRLKKIKKIKNGLIVIIKGNFWDISSDGQSFIILNDKLYLTPHDNKGRVIIMRF